MTKTTPLTCPDCGQADTIGIDIAIEASVTMDDPTLTFDDRGFVTITDNQNKLTDSTEQEVTRQTITGIYCGCGWTSDYQTFINTIEEGA